MHFSSLLSLIPLLALVSASPIVVPDGDVDLVSRDPGLLDGLGLGGGAGGKSSGAGATASGALDGVEGVFENLGLGGAGGAGGAGGDANPLSGLLGGL